MSKKTMLKVSDLFAGYKGKAAAADVSFTLGEGEILCLVGESGCGKSTLLKALISSPEIETLSGEIEVEGTALLGLSEKERVKICQDKMGMVFQNPESSFNPIRTYEVQFIETLKSHGKYDKENFHSQVAEAFAKVELNEPERILKQCPYALSGGMNQRVALALAMLLGQDILLGDEPTSALDATIQLQVAQELKRLRDKNGLTQVIVTHNLALAKYLADRIGVMYAGRLVEIGSAEELLSDPRHPYTRSLIEAIPELNGGLPTGLPGQPPNTGPKEKGCEFADRCPIAGEGCADKEYRLEDLGNMHFAACCREGGTK